MSGSTLSTTVTKEIFLSSGVYLNPLTVSATGGIIAPAPDTSFQNAAAIYADVSGASILNDGIISGAIPATDSYTAPAILSIDPLNLANEGIITGQSGVYLQDGGTVANTGSISGTQAGTSGGYGVMLFNAVLANTGTVYGENFGVDEFNASEVVNAGNISGGTAGIELLSAQANSGGTLINAGRISGTIAGVTETSALITNSGLISGQTYGLRVSWGGSVDNTGTISGLLDGVQLLNLQYQAKYATTFTNAGMIQGGYVGLAVNFAYVTNTATGLILGATFGAGVGASGYLSNAGSISGGYGGLALEDGSRARNVGTVQGTAIGADLFGGSILTNASAGYIGSATIAALDPGAYLDNAGRLLGDEYGLEILSGGIVLNAGTISSPRTGVYLSTLKPTGSPDFLGNTGSIYGEQFGVDLKAGTVENYGQITSGQDGVSLVTSTSLLNSGYIHGTQYGVQNAGGTVTNRGTISGVTGGIHISHGYLTTSGTISGTYAVYGQSFSLTVDPGAVFVGKVADKTKSSRLNLAGDTPGTLSGLGSQFTGFDAINFEAGAHWLVSGSSAALAANQPISGFEQGDTLILTGFSATSDSFVTGTGLELVSGASRETLDIAGSFTTANFTVASSAAGTTIALGAGAPCFVAGTRILTLRGEIAVEDLMVGEPVLTQNGEALPVVWIGTRSIDLRLHPHPEWVRPVCIAAGALGRDVPRRDLLVSPDHAMLIDDALVPAQLLLNGLNIYAAAPGRVTYYHVELARHSVIFAEHAPAESYLETGNRHAFENAGGGMMLHPDFSAMLRDEKSCVALLLTGEKLERIRQTIRQRFVPAKQQLGR